MALEDQPSRLFSNRSKPKAKIRIRGPIFPKKKKNQRRIAFHRGSVTSFPKIILGIFFSVREACESRPCAIEYARRLERPKEEINLELEFIQSFIKHRDVNLSDFFIKSNFKGARANLKTTF